MVALEDRAIDLKRLGEALGAGRLSFGSAERLKRHLGVEPGSVTPLSRWSTTRPAPCGWCSIAASREGGPVNAHPLVNTMTTAMARPTCCASSRRPAMRRTGSTSRSDHSVTYCN